MMQTRQILRKMVETYQHKIDGGDPFIVQLDIQPDEFLGHVLVDQEQRVVLVEGLHPEACFTITMTVETLQRIDQGKISAFTAAARERISDPAPVDFRLSEMTEFSPALYGQLIAFVQHFFWSSDPERIRLGKEHSRLIHGGHAIPLFYGPGFRSAWYLVGKGEYINESGEHNPFPQGFIFIAGEGKAEIGDKTISVKAGEAYYIPPDTRHTVWTESETPLTLLWLAWGEGA